MSLSQGSGVALKDFRQHGSDTHMEVLCTTSPQYPKCEFKRLVRPFAIEKPEQPDNEISANLVPVPLQHSAVF
jgi:hypothetical protein